MKFLKTTLVYLSTKNKIRELESEIQTITERIKNRNTENEKLVEFKTSLQKTVDELSDRREDIAHYDFAYSLLKEMMVLRLK